MSDTEETEGDEQPESISHLIQRFDRWGHTVANAIRDPLDPEHDDLVQESRIAIWKASQKLDPQMPGAHATYLTRAAKWRMREVSKRQTWTGHTRKHGQSPDVLMTARVSIEQAREEWTEAYEPQDVHSAQALELVTMAYHDGLIAEAIASLPPRQRAYVIQRFWHGKTDVEIAAERDMGASSPTWEWHNKIAPILRERLAHLASLVTD